MRICYYTWNINTFHFSLCENLAIFAVMKINVEDLRDYCLSLGDGVEEKMPFGKFQAASEVLVFCVCGHMFCFFDLAHFTTITVKCQPQHINELRAEQRGVVAPYNMNPRHWIGLDVETIDESLALKLIADSYRIVKEKYTKKRP